MVYDDSSIQPLSIEEYLTKALLSFTEVFSMPCSVHEPFTAKMDSRFVLINFGGSIDEKIFTAIQSAANQVGDDGFFFSPVVEVRDSEGKAWLEEAEIGGYYYPGLAPHERSKLETKFVEFSRKVQFLKQPLILSMVMYSPQAKWGAYVHWENFIVLGCDKDFAKAFNQNLPNIESYTKEFVLHWRNMYLHNDPSGKLRIEDGWVAKILTHAYGFDGAHQILNQY